MNQKNENDKIAFYLLLIWFQKKTAQSIILDSYYFFVRIIGVNCMVY